MEASSPPVSREPNTLYIIDDDAMAVEAFVGYANVLGLSARTAGGWREVDLDALRRVDCVMLDLSLPGTDGIDIIELLKQEHIGCPVIICSGHDTETINSAADLVRAQGIPLAGCLQKPFTLAQFEQTVDTALKWNQSRAAEHNIVDARSIDVDQIRQAIADQCLYPVFQPQVCADSGEVVGIECLARMNLPDWQDIHPDSFLPSAILAHLTDELTLQMVHLSLSQLEPLWRHKKFVVSLNLHPSSLTTGFFKELDQAVGQHGIDRQSIVFEVIESAALSTDDELKKVLTKMRLSGYGLSLDDFGTGYSTVKDLDALPFNEVKVDKRFVQSMLHRPTADAIVESTLGLAKQLGYRVVAEGVESAAQVERLKSKGCDVYQGFWFSKPLGLEQLTRFVLQAD